jgi:hypothetical protein
MCIQGYFTFWHVHTIADHHRLGHVVQEHQKGLELGPETFLYLEEQHSAGSINTKYIVKDYEMVDDQPFFDVSGLAISTQQSFDVTQTFKVVLKISQTTTTWIVIVLDGIHQKVLIGQFKHFK